MSPDKSPPYGTSGHGELRARKIPCLFKARVDSRTNMAKYVDPRSPGGTDVLDPALVTDALPQASEQFRIRGARATPIGGQRNK